MSEIFKDQSFLIPQASGEIAVKSAHNRIRVIDVHGEREVIQVAHPDSVTGKQNVPEALLSDESQQRLAEELADDRRSPEVRAVLDEFPVEMAVTAMRNQYDTQGKLVARNTVSEEGWGVRQVYSVDQAGKVVAVVIDNGRGLLKAVSPSTLREWQPVIETVSDDTMPRAHFAQLLANAPAVQGVLSEIVPIPKPVEFSVPPVIEKIKPVMPELTPERKDNIKAAEEMIKNLLGQDGNGGGLLGERLKQYGNTPEAIRQALEKSPDSEQIRSEILSTLMVRMHMLLGEGGKFHERVQRNDPNNLMTVPVEFGYEKEKYPSDEWVTMLALAKIDGSFVASNSRNNFTVPDDHAHAGQHRQAADTLLASFIEENEQKEKKVEFSDDEELAKTQLILEGMKQDVAGHIRSVMSLFGVMEQQLSSGDMINLEYMQSLASEMRTGLTILRVPFENATEGIRGIKVGIDELRPSDRTSEVLQTIQQRLNTYMSMLDDLAMTQLGTIDRLTVDMNSDRHMGLEYRSRVPQILQNMAQTLESLHSSVQNFTLNDV